MEIASNKEYTGNLKNKNHLRTQDQFICATNYQTTDESPVFENTPLQTREEIASHRERLDQPPTANSGEQKGHLNGSLR